MRTLLLIAVFPALAVGGAEPDAPSMRQKIHAKIVQSLPPPPPAVPSNAPSEEATPPIIMAPLIVSETKRWREITAAIDGEKQARKDEAFTPLEGGKIYSLGVVQFGSWWSPEEGWTFLRLNKAPTARQAEARKVRLKELNAFLVIEEKTKP